jgi:hypothetical protein
MDLDSKGLSGILTEQGYTENQVANKPNDKPGDPNWYRIGVPIEARTYGITEIASDISIPIEIAPNSASNGNRNSLRSVDGGKCFKKSPDRNG